jgi:formylglycine-generating enzyme required for sulfatase activity
MGEALLHFIRTAHQSCDSRLGRADLRASLREAVAAPLDTVDLALRDAVYRVAGDRTAEDRAALTGYLELIPSITRQSLRRPGDPAGTSVPEHLPIDKPEDWLVYFPDRLARFHSADTLEVYDNWLAADLRGFGPFGETWRGWMPQSQDKATAALKFITAPEAAVDFARHEDLFRRVLDLEPMSGLVQLRSVYLLADPPCLESVQVAGYDATGLICDWRWRVERTKPDQAALIVKRVARTVGKLHRMEPPLVHRGLKPSNILFHPTSEGRVTIWITDIGWGELSTAHSLANPEPVQARRQARRGAFGPLYASQQQKAGEPPDPRDDVYALGVIWYQLLCRDPAAPPPLGTEWALEFREAGMSDGHARLLASCLEEDPDLRPPDGSVLAAQIDANFTTPPKDGSQSFRLKGSSGNMRPLSQPTPGTPIQGKDGKSRQSSDSSLDTGPITSFTNSVGMEFGLIMPGKFAMGSPPEEKSRHEWEGPVHTVKLTRPYYFSIHPVTQSQYQLVTGRNPSYFVRTLGGSPDHPVEQVTWDDALAFCNRLTESPEEAAQGRVYRLPTEAEWEYACRAGTSSPYHFGESVSLQEVHYFGLSAATWNKVASTAGKTEKVGSHSPNAWGLYDMHGNVLEWCHDWWSDDYYANSPKEDPLGPTDGNQRVVRGGSFSQFAADCRSAARLGRAPASKLNTIGFRVVMTRPGKMTQI